MAGKRKSGGLTDSQLLNSLDNSDEKEIKERTHDETSPSKDVLGEDVDGELEPGDSDMSSVENLVVEEVLGGHDKNSTPKDSSDKIYVPKRRRVVRTGSQKKNVWTQFKETYEGTSKLNVCKYCDEHVSPKAQRMEVHLTKCQNYINSKMPRKIPSEFGSVVTENSSPPPKSSMDYHVDRMVESDKNEWHILVARYIFGSNLPFSHVENKYFLEIMKKARPAYKPPTAKILGSTLLNKVHEQSVHDMTMRLKGQKVAILQDGWETNKKDPVISHVIQHGSTTYFWNGIPTTTNSNDAVYCGQLLENCIDECHQQLDCNVVGVITDNCPVMESMRSKFAQKYPRIIVLRCHAHLLNLIGKKLTPVELKDEIVQVQKYFKNHQFEGQSLKVMRGHRPKLPIDVRWNSQLDCFENYLHNHTLYLRISRLQNSSVPEDVRAILTNMALYDRLNELVGKLKPIAAALNRLQGDKSRIADAVSQWLKLDSELPQDVLDSSVYKEKRALALTPVCIAAYMLHPVYRGEGLGPELKEEGRGWLFHRHPVFVIVASHLEHHDDTYFSKIFLDMEVARAMDPEKWWRDASGRSCIPPLLRDLADTLMLMPSSTGGIERSFSTMGNIITDTRNQLGIVKASKLCTIFKSMNNHN